MKRTKEKVSYEISPDNRLIIRKGDLLGRRQVVDGTFTSAGGGRLVYQVKVPPAERRRMGVPARISLSGQWSLTENHDLRFSLDETGESAGGKLVISGDIVGTEKGELTFAVATASAGSRRSVYLLHLGGCWQADERNRLCFRVGREEETGVLTFEAAWEVNRRQQIVYRYRKSGPGRKKDGEREIVFAGTWDAGGRKRLGYWLDLKRRSGFEFRAEMEPLKVNGREGQVGFRLEIGLSRRNAPVRRQVTLVGKWNFGAKGGVYFELAPSSPGLPARLLVGGNRRMKGEREIEFDLSNGRGRIVAAGVVLKKKFFRDEALLYLKLRKEGAERAVEAALVRRF